MNTYLLRRGNQDAGTFKRPQLIRAIRSGQISAEDELSSDNGVSWKHVGRSNFAPYLNTSARVVRRTDKEIGHDEPSPDITAPDDKAHYRHNPSRLFENFTPKMQCFWAWVQNNARIILISFGILFLVGICVKLLVLETRQPDTPTPSYFPNDKQQSQTAGPKPFKGRVYRSLDGETVITFVSSDELEMRDHNGLNLVSKYSQQGDTYRVIVNALGMTQAVYYKITADGLVDEHGNILYDPSALQRQHPEYQRRQAATRTLEDLRLLDSATDQYAIETNKTTGMHPTFADLKNYLKSGTVLYDTDADVFGVTYGPFTVDSIPKVSESTFNALSDVADDSFWSPYK